jgi:hypothetical protein
MSFNKLNIKYDLPDFGVPITKNEAGKLNLECEKTSFSVNAAIDVLLSVLLLIYNIRNYNI